MTCATYVTDFSYFPLERNCRKLLDTVRTGKKWGVDGFSYFSLISVILFSNQIIYGTVISAIFD